MGSEKEEGGREEGRRERRGRERQYSSHMMLTLLCNTFIQFTQDPAHYIHYIHPHLSTNMTTVLCWFFHCSKTGRSRLTFWPPPGYLTTSPPLHCSPIPTTYEEGLSIFDKSLQKPVVPLNITSTFRSNSRADRIKRWYPSVSSVAMVTICSLRSSAQTEQEVDQQSRPRSAMHITCAIGQYYTPPWRLVGEDCSYFS